MDTEKILVKNSNCPEGKIDSLKKCSFKSLGGYYEVNGCVKNGWVSINT